MNPAEKEAHLLQLQQQCEQLRRAYERHWQGIERQEPLLWRERMRGELQRLRAMGEAQSSAAFAFRARGLQASFLAFDELCTRRARERDEGRGVKAARPRMGAAGAQAFLAPSPPPSPPPNEAAVGLYDELVAAYAQQKRAAPARALFEAQLQRFMETARAQRPGVALRPKLVVQPDGRVQLVVDAKNAD